MRAIFISHRREDSEEASRLRDELARHFGKQAVFLSASEAAPGRDDPRAIEERIAWCQVLLVLMGDSWLDARDDAGRRRLDDPGDAVRLEATAALKRGIPVVPVLVQEARSPLVTQLPDELAELAFCDPIELTPARRDAEVAGLIHALSRYVARSGDARASVHAGRRHSLRLAAALAALLGSGVVVYGLEHDGPDLRHAIGHLQGIAEAAVAVAAASASAAAPALDPEADLEANIAPTPSEPPPDPEAAPSPLPQAAPVLARVAELTPPLPPETVTLVSWWSATQRDHLLTSEPPWFGRTSVRQETYAFSRDEAIVFDPAQPQPQGSVPLFTWRRNRHTGYATQDYFTTSAPLWRASPGALGARRTAERAREGYRPYRLEGYVYDPAAPQPRGTRPLFSWYSAVSGDYFTTTRPEWCMPIAKRGIRCEGASNRAPHRDGYGFVRLEGFVR